MTWEAMRALPWWMVAVFAGLCLCWVIVVNFWVTAHLVRWCVRHGLIEERFPGRSLSAWSNAQFGGLR